MFGDNGLRLMCWPHANRKIEEKLKPVSAVNKELSEKVLEDIQTFQWTTTNTSFEKDFNALEVYQRKRVN